MSQVAAALVAAALWITGIWKAFQAAGRPASRGIRLLSVFYICLALTVTVFSSPDFVDSLLTSVFGPSPSAFLRNILPIPGLYAGVAFLLYSGGERSRSSVFWCLRFPFALWTAISLPAWFLTPLEHRGDALTDVTSTGHVIFFAVTLVGLGYSTTCLAAPVTYQLARQAPDHVAQRSLYLAVIGFALCIPFFVGPRMVALLLALAGYSPSPVFEQISVVGQLTALGFFLAGFGGPVIRAKASAIRLWFTHLLLTRKMYPLWEAIGALTADYQLLREGEGGWLRGRVHHRFYRRVIECRDGLVLAGRLADRSAAPSCVDEEAELLLAVLAARAEREHVDTPAPPGRVFAAAAGPTVEDDAAALITLASAVRAKHERSPQKTRVSRTPDGRFDAQPAGDCPPASATQSREQARGDVL